MIPPLPVSPFGEMREKNRSVRTWTEPPLVPFITQREGYFQHQSGTRELESIGPTWVRAVCGLAVMGCQARTAAARGGSGRDRPPHRDR